MDKLKLGITRVIVGLLASLGLNVIWGAGRVGTITLEGYLNVKTHSSTGCYTHRFQDEQIDTVIITPAAGKSIEIISVYVSVGTADRNVEVKFQDSGEIVFMLHTVKKSSQAGNEICARGGVDEKVTLTCPQDTFISIGYDEK